MPQTPTMTIAQAQEQLGNWTKALEACSTGASYSIAGRNLTRQDVPTIRDEIRRWHNTIAALEANHLGRGPRPLGARASFPAPGGGGQYVPWDDYRT